MALEPTMDVVIHGIDRDPEQVARNLGHLFGVDLQLARRIVRCVPYVAKRELPADEAHRYVRALTSSGCRAEARPSEALTLRPASRSLPAPRVSALPELEAEEQAAIARWRQAEGLAPVVSGPPRSSRELARSVPRAPRVPDDLLRVGQSAPTAMGGDGRPAWLTDDPGEVGLGSSNPPGAVPIGQRAGTTLSGRPGAVGLVRSAPPKSDSERIRAAAVRARSERTRQRLLLGLALGIVIGFGLWRMHGAQDARLRERWSAAGIVDAAPHMRHADWVEGADNRLTGSRAGRAPVLIDALERSGVHALWVVGYRAEGEGHVASRLVVELPEPGSARQTALWHLARFRGEQSPTDADPGGKYVEVDLR